MASIFIQIASYEDPELRATINDAIQKSSGLHTINFGVHASYVDEKDFDLSLLKNVKFTRTVPPNNIGLAVSRRLADEHYDGEDFYLQVDSHSRFKKDWDEFLVYEYYRYRGIGIENPLITAYPMEYWYQDGTEYYNTVDFVHTIDLTQESWLFKEWRYPKQTQVLNKNKSIFTPSVSGGSIFAKGKVPIAHKDIFFDGEEIVIAAMAYTQGFDLVLPQFPYMYHLYFSSYKEGDNKRKLVWANWPEEYSSLNLASKVSLRDMFTHNKVGKDYLGTVRSLKDFSEYCGLNFETGDINAVCY